MLLCSQSTLNFFHCFDVYMVI
uniref:Uncharacterized protein n=1 Tax=Anguilla anguilla TaxID=7936 RepID=A0A0E9TSJ6_ANGAN